ncbi:MAG: hypothetical protein MI919_15825, partial [Holophagales bacterium]|nr:hypothetical protein [Holophagales bacterium]
MVVWYTYDGKGIKGQLVDFGGVLLGAEFRVESYTTNYQVTPDVAADPMGGFVVTWNSGSEAHNGPDGNLLGVSGRRYDSDGSPVSSEFVVNSYVTGNQQNPAVSVAADGRFIVVWMSDASSGFDTDGSSIQGQLFGPDGARLSAEFQVNGYTSGSQTTPRVAFGPNGIFAVVWESEGSDGSDEENESIQLRRFTSDGIPINEEVQINTFTSGSQRRPEIAFAADGSSVVVWDTGSQSIPGPDGDRSGISARRIASDGSPIGDEFVVNSHTQNNQTIAELVVEDDGDFFIVWQSRDATNTDMEIQGQFFSSSGGRIGTEFQINTYTTSLQLAPAIGGNRSGDFVVTWESYGSLGSDRDERSVQARLFSLAGAVGDRVFFDSDFDGIQDSGEPGIPDIRVNLYDGASELQDFTRTDGEGEFRFVAEEGAYFLEFELPLIYSFTSQDRGSDDTLDSDADPGSGQTIDFAIIAGEDLSWDAGMTNGIGNFVWRDADFDGLQDGGELGMAAIPVALLDMLGTPIANTMTDDNGFYQFSNIPPGDYYLNVTAPSGYCFTSADQGPDEDRDSDIDVVTGNSPVFTFKPGEIDTSWDAGLVPEASLGDRVWHDLDGNGLQDGGEPGVSAVDVHLYDLTGTLLRSTTTDPTGVFRFSPGPG